MATPRKKTSPARTAPKRKPVSRVAQTSRGLSLTRRFSKTQLLIVVAVLVVIGIILIAVHAAGISAWEPETWTQTGTVAVGTDSGASNGKYVQFTQATPSATATTTPTGTAAPIPSVGAPTDVGLSVAASSLKTWTGPTTITPTTAGVVNGTVSGYLFTQPMFVNGNVNFTNDKFSVDAEHPITVTGTASPGPVFTHIEIDGQNASNGGSNDGDSQGITNSRHDGASGGPFTVDHAHIYGVVNGARLDNGAVLENTLIDGLATPSGAHVDGLEIYGGSHITVDHVTIHAFDAAHPDGSDMSSAIETQGVNGGFYPVSYVTFSNDIFGGGTATFRLEDTLAQVSHITVNNVTFMKGTGYYFTWSVYQPAAVDSWTNVKLSDGTVIPQPNSTSQTTWSECQGFGGSCH